MATEVTIPVSFIIPDDVNQLIDLWNDFCLDNSFEDYILPVADIDEVFDGLSFTEVVSAIDFDNFDINDKWYQDTPHGLISFNDEDVVDHIDLAMMSDYYETTDLDQVYRDLD